MATLNDVMAALTTLSSRIDAIEGHTTATASKPIKAAVKSAKTAENSAIEYVKGVPMLTVGAISPTHCIALKRANSAGVIHRCGQPDVNSAGRCQYHGDADRFPATPTGQVAPRHVKACKIVGATATPVKETTKPRKAAAKSTVKEIVADDLTVSRQLYRAVMAGDVEEVQRFKAMLGE